MPGSGSSATSAGERARLFVALELPGAVRAELEVWGAAQLPEQAGLRVVEPEALHVTLCFLGWRPVDQVERIAATYEAAASGPIAELTLGAPTWLGTRRARVIAVALADASGELARLQKAIAQALLAAGCYEPEARPFLAHVTVARVGRRDQLIRRELEPPAPITFEGRDVTLFRSWAGLGARRRPTGAKYEALRTTSLRG
jgi:RNA 2',3'-cyclic 3'-phosphodiesterase